MFTSYFSSLIHDANGAHRGRKFVDSARSRGGVVDRHAIQPGLGASRRSLAVPLDMAQPRKWDSAECRLATFLDWLRELHPSYTDSTHTDIVRDARSWGGQALLKLMGRHTTS